MCATVPTEQRKRNRVFHLAPHSSVFKIEQPCCYVAVTLSALMDRDWLRRQALELTDRADMHISVTEGSVQVDGETQQKAKAFLMLLRQECASNRTLSRLTLSERVTWVELLEFARGAYLAL